MVRVNVGCGRRPLPGYINLDMQRYAGAEYALAEFVMCDIRDGLPFEDESVAEVRADQFIEHLTLEELRAFLQECHRVLCEWGEVRLSFPDITAIAREAEAGRQDHVADRERCGVPGVPKGLCVLNHAVHGWGHRIILTAPLARVLIAQWFEPLWEGRNTTNAIIIARKNNARTRA